MQGYSRLSTLNGLTLIVPVISAATATSRCGIGSYFKLEQIVGSCSIASDITLINTCNQLDKMPLPLLVTAAVATVYCDSIIVSCIISSPCTSNRR